MTYSTVGWNSGLIKPVVTGDRFLIVINDSLKVYEHLCDYVPEIDGFTDRQINRTYPRSSVIFWAYVPDKLNLRREGKQSQIPDEK